MDVGLQMGEIDVALISRIVTIIVLVFGGVALVAFLVSRKKQ